jgi:predicted ester cyclase
MPTPVERFTRYLAFPDLKHQILTTVQPGDAVAAEARFTATHTGPLASPNGDIPPTGKPVTLDYVDVARFADGRITSEHIYFDQVAFLSQLGLLPA